MTCEECREQLSSLLDRELSMVNLRAVWEHLKSCTDCAHECAQMCCVDAATGQACCPEMRTIFWETIQAQVEECCPTRSPEVAREAILTPDEAARYLRVSVDELMLCLDELPHFRVGEQIRFRTQRLEEWVGQQERQQIS